MTRTFDNDTGNQRKLNADDLPCGEEAPSTVIAPTGDAKRTGLIAAEAVPTQGSSGIDVDGYNVAGFSVQRSGTGVTAVTVQVCTDDGDVYGDEYGQLYDIVFADLYSAAFTVSDIPVRSKKRFDARIVGITRTADSVTITMTKA